jgi:TolB-like protein
MRKRLSSGIASLIGLVFLFAFAVTDGGTATGKATVAVLDFESIGSEEYLGKAVAEIMRTELVGTDRFRVVERAQIKQALNEQALQMSGAIDTKSAIELGKLLRADLIIVGSVVKIGSSYTINSRMIDVKTGEAQLGRNATGNDLNLLTSLSRDLIDGLFGPEKQAAVGEKTLTSAPSPVPLPKKPEANVGTKPLSATTKMVQASEITWNFETGDLRGWETTGEAFRDQPTYGDNPTARHRGQPSYHQGEYWIGGFERRPHPDAPAGAIQGDGPRGTLTSIPFVIATPRITFLIGGGCDLGLVRAELLVNEQAVHRTTGQCDESMQREQWDVARFVGQTARVRLVDQSSDGWGHLNFDDLRFEGQEALETDSPVTDSPAISWNFEDPRMPGWERTGTAFLRQPTYGDNPTARGRGQASGHQGNYWIGGFENRPSPTAPAGAIQGDEPQGVLTSAPFIVSRPVISFLIGGGCDLQREYVELRVLNRSELKATGFCSETMQRVRWNVAHLQGKEARILIVDRSSEGWGHINVDDFRFE